MASLTSASAAPPPYISAVSISVRPLSRPVRRAANSVARRAGCSPMYQVPKPSAGTVPPLGRDTARMVGAVMAGVLRGVRVPEREGQHSPRRFTCLRAQVVCAARSMIEPWPLDRVPRAADSGNLRQARHLADTDSRSPCARPARGSATWSGPSWMPILGLRSRSLRGAPPTSTRLCGPQSGLTAAVLDRGQVHDGATSDRVAGGDVGAGPDASVSGVSAA
jgi:hypothetical protein